MERSQVLDAMSQFKLYGMKAAYDEIDPAPEKWTGSGRHALHVGR
jgi:hypothetical protein